MPKPPSSMRQWSIVTQITLLVCSIVALFIISGGVILIKFERDLINRFVTRYVVKINTSLDIQQQQIAANLQEFIAFIGEFINYTGAEAVFTKDYEPLKTTLAQYLKHEAIIAIRIQDADAKPLVAIWKQQQFILQADVLPDDILTGAAEVAHKDILYHGKKIGTVDIYYRDEAMTARLDAIKNAALQETDQFTVESRALFERTIINQAIVLIVLLLVLILVLGGFLRGIIRQPLVMLTKIAYRLREFDLTLDLKSTRRDEIGVLLAALQESIMAFKTLIGQVQQSGLQVTTSTTQLSATAKEQEAIMNTQVDSTNGVLKSIEEISDITDAFVQTMQQIVVKFQETAEFASLGQADLRRMEDAIQHMEASSLSISGRLRLINEKADNITSVVTTITKVADQTNLLSLNAAIEAEKAGEYGRGFTVVAREIRRLADQTAVATLDIEQMVKEMQSAVSTGVMEMDKFIADVRQGTQDVERISLQLSRIIEQVQALSPSFDTAHNATSHQAEHVQNIRTAMTRLTEEMYETKMSLQETYVVINQLNEAAHNLRQEVSHFKVHSD